MPPRQQLRPGSSLPAARDCVQLTLCSRSLCRRGLVPHNWAAGHETHVALHRDQVRVAFCEKETAMKTTLTHPGWFWWLRLKALFTTSGHKAVRDKLSPRARRSLPFFELP